MPAVAGGVPGRSGQTFRVYEWGCRGSKLQGGRQVYFLVISDPRRVGFAKLHIRSRSIAFVAESTLLAYSAKASCRPGSVTVAQSPNVRITNTRMSRGPSLRTTEKAFYAELLHGHPRRALGRLSSHSAARRIMSNSRSRLDSFSLKAGYSLWENASPNASLRGRNNSARSDKYLAGFCSRTSVASRAATQM
jgi:hypothetical protein